MVNKRHSPLDSSLRDVWRRHGYKRKGVDYLTFRELSQQPCWLCGALPKPVKITHSKYTSEEWRQERNKIRFNGVDHVIPLSRGGTNDIENLKPCCGICNRAKYTQTIDELELWAWKLLINFCTVE